eukprot:4462460-Amphidinium_carterae.1
MHQTNRAASIAEAPNEKRRSLPTQHFSWSSVLIARFRWVLSSQGPYYHEMALSDDHLCLPQFRGL